MQKLRDFAVLGGISLTGRFVAALLDRGLRPTAIVLGGDDLDDELAGLDAPAGEPPEWWQRHAFMAGGWRAHLQDLARRADVPVLCGEDPYALLPETSVLVVAGFAWRVPPAVTRRYGDWALNVHPSLLPRFAGPQPEVQTILHEQPEAGVSVHTMTQRFDAGPIRAQRSFRLHERMTVGEVEERAAVLGAECIEQLLAMEQLPVLASTAERSYFQMLPVEAADLARCRSLAEAQTLLRLRPEVYPYWREGDSTVYPLVVEERACRSPSLALPDGTLRCHEWVVRASDGSLRHHRCDCVLEPPHDRWP